jgi:UDP-N-acetylmuramoylalanine--D-glutamate ligase
MNAAMRKSATSDPRRRARRTIVVGLGRTGLSCARYLSAHGARVAITDSRSQPPELANLGDLAGKIELHLGGFEPSLLADAGQIVVSPGVALAEPFLREAVARGVEVVGPSIVRAACAGHRRDGHQWQTRSRRWLPKW